MDSILVDKTFDLLVCEMDVKEAEGSTQSGYEFILNTVSLSQLVIVLKESLDSYLFLPYFSADFGFNVSNVSVSDSIGD
jgi:hypothetical protein